MKKTKIGSKEEEGGGSPSQRIDARIKELSDWRGKTLARIRALIKQADPEVVEEWKWAKPTNPGTPVWSHAGILSTAGDGGHTRSIGCGRKRAHSGAPGEDDTISGKHLSGICQPQTRQKLA